MGEFIMLVLWAMALSCADPAPYLVGCQYSLVLDRVSTSPEDLGLQVTEATALSSGGLLDVATSEGREHNLARLSFFGADGDLERTGWLEFYPSVESANSDFSIPTRSLGIGPLAYASSGSVYAALQAEFSSSNEMIVHYPLNGVLVSVELEVGEQCGDL